MTGFTSKRKMAQDKATTRPVEADYASQVAYTRALEAYCDSLAQPAPRPWVGLTDDEIDYWLGCNTTKGAVARAIEQALKEKNFG